MEIRNVCLCGGGSLSHVVAGWLAREGYGVSVFTRSPERWDRNLTIHTPEGGFTVPLKAVSADPAEVIADADVVLLTVPGYGNRDILTAIKPWLKKDVSWAGSSARRDSSLRLWRCCQRR